MKERLTAAAFIFAGPLVFSLWALATIGLALFGAAYCLLYLLPRTLIQGADNT